MSLSLSPLPLPPAPSFSLLSPLPPPSFSILSPVPFFFLYFFLLNFFLCTFMHFFLSILFFFYLRIFSPSIFMDRCINIWLVYPRVIMGELLALCSTWFVPFLFRVFSFDSFLSSLICSFLLLFFLYSFFGLLLFFSFFFLRPGLLSFSPILHLNLSFPLKIISHWVWAERNLSLTNIKGLKSFV